MDPSAVLDIRKTPQSSKQELILFGCCFNFRIFQLFRIIFIVIDFSFGIVYAVLTVTDINTYRRLPNTDLYNVSKFEIAIRIGFALRWTIRDGRLLVMIFLVKWIPKSIFFFLAMIHGIIITICYSKLPPVLGTISGADTACDSNLDQKNSCMPRDAKGILTLYGDMLEVLTFLWLRNPLAPLCMPDIPLKIKIQVIKKEENQHA